VTAPAETDADRTVVEFPSTDGFRGVGRLVLGGVAARFELPIDRVDDLLLAVDSVLLQGPVGDRVRVEALASPTGLVVRLSPFRPGRLDDAALRRVLARLVDSVDEHGDGDGDTSAIELAVSASYPGGGTWRP
jgi:hypothetical protein